MILPLNLRPQWNGNEDNAKIALIEKIVLEIRVPKDSEETLEAAAANTDFEPYFISQIY